MVIWYIFPVLVYCTKKSGNPGSGDRVSNFETFDDNSQVHQAAQTLQ
jgi:hypothetical protein